MALDGITLAALCCELKKKLTGGKLAKIAQPEERELLLTVKGSEGPVRLLLSADPSLPLTYLTAANRSGPLAAPGFLMLLRKHLQGGRIIEVSQPRLERVLQLRVEHLDEMGDLNTKTLSLELMGKHSNLILIDENDTILGAIRSVSSATSSVREVLPGRPYFIPNTKGKTSPLELTREGFDSALAGRFGPVEKALCDAFCGISPLIARELCRRAGLDGAENVAELAGTSAAAALWTCFDETMGQVARGEFAPRVYYHNGKLLEFAPFALSIYEGEEARAFDSMSEAVETFYAQRTDAARLRQKSADLRHILQLSMERTAKKRDLQAKQLKTTEKRDQYKLWGELLQAFGYGLEPRADHLDAPNYYDEDRIVRIPLDPELTARENAQHYFERYAKLKRTFEATTEQLAETERDLEYLRSVESALALASSEEDLGGIKAELMETGWIRRTRTNSRKDKLPAAGRPLHYVSDEGVDFFVGKNNLQNEELDFKFASGNDWWFHTKGLPGSHVIVKTGGAELSDRGFEQAAALAAYYSSAPKDGKCEVDYTLRKELKKPASYKPGMVIYHTNYSMVVTPSVEGLTLVK